MCCRRNFYVAKKRRNGRKLATRPGIAKFVASMDPDKQNFKECASLFIYKLVLGVLHKKHQVRYKTLSFRRKRNRGQKTANPLYFAIIQNFDFLIRLTNFHIKSTQSICINKS